MLAQILPVAQMPSAYSGVPRVLEAETANRAYDNLWPLHIVRKSLLEELSGNES